MAKCITFITLKLMPSKVKRHHLTWIYFSSEQLRAKFLFFIRSVLDRWVSWRKLPKKLSSLNTEQCPDQYNETSFEDYCQRAIKLQTLGCFRIKIQKLLSMDLIERSEVLSSDSGQDIISNRAFDAMKARRKMRQQRVSAIQVHLDQVSAQPLRKQRWLSLYALQVMLTIGSAIVNAKLLINDEGRRQLYAIIIISCLSLTCIITFIGNVMVSNLKTALLLYVQMDSILPAMIAASTGLRELLKFRPVWPWENYVFLYIYPVWMVCLAGTLRVHIKCERFTRLRIIIFKMTAIICGFLTFYVGFTFMNGGYQISQGLMPALQSKYKNLVYLYVFGLVEYFFEFVRRITDFDQTTDLNPAYEFKSQVEKQASALNNVEVRQAEAEAVVEDAVGIIFETARLSGRKSQ